jgi:hypothetical protein
MARAGISVGRAVQAQGAGESDPRAAGREARAERYFEHDLKGQRRWYSEHASAYSRRAQLLGLLVIIAGALTAALQALGPAPWVPVATALLGGLVAVAEGWQRTARYAESWKSYRVASERMKRERRLYVNGAGEYRGLGDEEEAFLRFVENIEAVIAEEQQLYWSRRGGEAPGTAAATTGDQPPAGG